MKDAPEDTGIRFWYLEGFVDENRRLRRVPILKLPFRIGRQGGLDLTLSSDLVSVLHAEIFELDNELRIQDHESTNGTFLNRQRLSSEAPLKDGDVLHFANLEFRLGVLEPNQTEAIFGSTVAMSSELPEMLVDRVQNYRKLLKKEAVKTVYQPIVELQGRRTIGYELLGRPALPDLVANTGQLFELAAVTGTEAELSRLFRWKGMVECAQLNNPLRFFFNTHPAELRESGLLDSIIKLRQSYPEVNMTLEIHEAAVTDPASMRGLKQQLADLDVEIAYDDFGAGQARLLELAEAPPDYLKFDRALIKEIDQASQSRQRLLEALAKIAIDLDIPLLAEGLENNSETEICQSMGFRYGQGYHLGRPVSGSALNS